MKPEEEQGWGWKGGRWTCTGTWGFGAVSLPRQPAKGGLTCGWLPKPVWLKTSPAIAPELWAESPWYAQGLIAGEGRLQDWKNPMWEALVFCLGQGSHSRLYVRGCRRTRSEAEGRETGKAPEPRDVGRGWRLMQRDSSTGHWATESSPWAGITPHPRASREQINTTAINREYTRLVFFHIKALCATL